MIHGCVSPRGAWWPLPAVALLALLAVGLAAPATAANATGEWDQDLGPVTIVTNDWVDVRDILPSVAANTGLGLQMTADVTGQVNVHLENVPARQALSALLDPIQLDYVVEKGVLIVHKSGLVSRWLKFDYPVTLREGRGELQISASSEQGGGSGGSDGGSGGEGGGSNQNKSHVTSTATMSVWPEVMAALEVIIFQGGHMEDQHGNESEGQSVNLSDAEGRTLVVNPMASLIHVRAEKDRVQEVETLLANLQAALQQQVAIEVRIMEVALDKDLQTGIDWTSQPEGRNPSVDSRARLSTLDQDGDLGQEFFQFVMGTKDIDVTLRALSSSGTLRSISTPRITTLNNQKAVVRVVKEDVFFKAQVEPAIITNGVASEPVINYTAQSVSVGVILDVTPQVGVDGTITLNVHPTISDITGIAVSPNQDSAPILSVRELDTVGTVKAGQTLVIAGLISERVSKTRSGIPLLKDLPLLGALFGTTQDTRGNIELVMLLTPTLLNDGQAIEADHQETLARVDRP